MDTPSPTQIDNRDLALIAAHWRRLRRDMDIPNRRDFDPVSLPGRVWSNLFLVDVLEAPLAFRFRVLGERAIEIYGANLTGLVLDETQIPGISRSHTLRLLREAAATREIQHYKGRGQLRDRTDWRHIELVLMPLSIDGRVAAVLGAIDVVTAPVKQTEPAH